MTFRIFATSGRQGYSSLRDDQDDEEDIAKTAVALPVGGASSLLGAAKEVAGMDISRVGKLFQKVGTIQFSGMIQDSVIDLARPPNGQLGYISIWATQRNLLLPDVSRSARVPLDQDNPGLAFLRRAKPVLSDTGLWTVGVMHLISDALANYKVWLGFRPDATPMLTLQITKKAMLS